MPTANRQPPTANRQPPTANRQQPTANSQQHKVRVVGIDAPENAQPFGQRSKENLSRLVFVTEVRVAWGKRDRYG